MSADEHDQDVACADDDLHSWRERETAALATERRRLLAALADNEAGPSPAHTRRLRSRLDEVTAALFDLHYGLVESQVRRFRPFAGSGGGEDIEAAARLGLMSAIVDYRPESGRFAGWAYPKIFREVLDAVRASDHPLLSRSDFERRQRVLAASRALSESRRESGGGNPSPSPDEVAAVCGEPVAAVARILRAPRVESLDSPVGGNCDGRTLGDLVADRPGAPEDGPLLAAADAVAMTARELAVLVRRYGLDGGPGDSFTNMGVLLGLSRETARRDAQRALAKLRHPSRNSRLRLAG